MEPERFTLFYDGIFSQWYPCDFEVDGVLYCCAEQYMMAMKALLFEDADTHERIMESESPRRQKALGRVVDGFDPDTWEEEDDSGIPRCWGIVWKGNHAKFTQNPALLALLLQTAGTTLVEASPTDTLWGIGRAEDDPLAHVREAWRGLNWLGEVLTDLREHLLSEAR